MELMRAAYKWAPQAAAANDSLAAARDSALDFFLLLPADPIGQAQHMTLNADITQSSLTGSKSHRKSRSPLEKGAHGSTAMVVESAVYDGLHWAQQQAGLLFSSIVTNNMPQ